MKDQTKIDLEKKLMDKSLLTLDEIFRIQMYGINEESPMELMKRVDIKGSYMKGHITYNIQFENGKIKRWT